MTLNAVSNFFLGTLRGRLVLTAAALHAVLMALFILDSTFRQRTMLLENQTGECTAMTHALAVSAAGWIVADDVSGLQELVNSQLRYPELQFAIITDTEGLILAHTDQTRIGQYVLDLPQQAEAAVISRSQSLVDVAVPAAINSRTVGWARVGIGHKRASQNLTSITILGFAYAALAILIGSVAAWRMGKKVTQRLYAVQDTMTQVRAGITSARSTITGADEAASIAREFNTMLDALEERDRAVVRSEAKYRSLVQNVHVAVVVHGLDGRVLLSNPMACQFMGLTEDQFTGKSAMDPAFHLLDEYGRRLRPEDYPVSEAIASRTLVRDRVAGAVRPDGTTRWFLVNAEPIADEAGNLAEVVATFVDITDRKQAEIEREQYFKFFNTSRDLMGITDLHGVFKRVNRAFLDTLGYSEEELTSGPLVRFVLPQDQRDTLDETARMRETGQTARFENRFICKDGSIRWLSWHSIVNYQEGLAYATARDITEQKQAEEELRQTEARQRQLEKELIQAQKLESLGTLASGVAHDFNNLLGIILGYASMLGQQPLDAKVLERIRSIEQAALRGASLVKQLLTIARKGESHFEPLSINDIARETMELLNRTIPRTISLESELSDIEPVRGDSAQIHQILLNICLNARDAMPQGGSLRITSRMADNATVAAEFPRASAEEYVQLTIADSGSGMDEETKRRIFEPFFTTKGPGKGSGLGLTLVYSIVENHRGFIAVDSTPGAGTAFRIYLPVDRSPATAGQQSPRKVEIPGGTETILFIEDEEMLAAIIREILSEKGYRVLVAADGETGVALFQEKHQEIDIVLSDLGLPGLPGEEVVRRIKSIEPRAIVLVASGFVDPGVRARLTELGVRHVIQKPYAPVEVLEVLRAAIDAGKPIPL